ncbi:MAG: peptidoglycan DD-metalloendopeptidase family protein [Bacteroidales bacterium]|nr:peptidoglycan DD-metalloendopeptidase family protein [Bacteroidales bacterium]
MRNYLRIIILVLFVAIGQYASAQLDTSTSEIFESRNDSIDMTANFYNIYDSLTKLRYPANYIYHEWNTHKIHFKLDGKDFKLDSQMIVLQNRDENKLYYHPFKGVVTSRFGYRRYRFHYGIDIDLITGDQVVSAFDGMVRVVMYDKGYGNVVVIRNDNGLEAVYGHLLRPIVDTNQVVKAGDVIGFGGNTGRSSGSHLHFELRYLGAALNPESVIDFEKFTLLSDTVFLTPNNFKYLNRIKADKNAKYHTVRSGDNLGKIAHRYHTSVSKLCYLNGINQNSIIRIGQKIRIR